MPALDNMAWRLEPGTDLVLQLHLRPTGSQERVRPRVAFHFTEKPPDQRPALLVLESAMIDIPPGDPAYRVTNSYELPVAVDLLSVYPHAHYLGKDLEDRRCFRTVPSVASFTFRDWDFDWQDEYRFVEPMRLPAGTVLTLSFTFDSSADNPRNPSEPPVRVTYGLNSTDEMAQLILQALPRNARDRQTLVEDVAWHHRGESMAYMAAQAVRAGDRSLDRNDPDRAIPRYQEALQYRSDHAEALVGLSRAFAAKGDFESARLVGERATTVTGSRDPTALSALADAYAGLGDARALSVAEDALRLARARGHAALADSLEARLPRYRRIGR